MANRFMSRAEVEGVPIWYSQQEFDCPEVCVCFGDDDATGGLWMERKDPLTNYEWLKRHPDAINVTNAYEVLPLKTIIRLMDQSGRGGPG